MEPCTITSIKGTLITKEITYTPESPEDYEYPFPDQENGTVDVNWQVEEKSGDQLELSAGFGGGIGVTGTLGVTFNNFSAKNIFKKSAWDPLPMGDGQKLSLRVQSNGRAYRSYNASFTEPILAASFITNCLFLSGPDGLPIGTNHSPVKRHL